jgi:uncharacterized protein
MPLAKSPDGDKTKLISLKRAYVVIVNSESQQIKPGEANRSSPQLERLRQAIEHASHLLPAQGPITVFIHHNTLHAFESMTFDEGVRRGGAIFGCEPYLSEQRYREALTRGRIRFADLRAVLEELPYPRATALPPALGKPIDLLLTMLECPLPTGSDAELRWFVAETDALRKVRREASAPARAKLIAETRRWVLREIRIWNGTARQIPGWVPELFQRFQASRIEDWTEETWEAFSLEALWRICCEGVAGVPATPCESRLPVRHRDLLLATHAIDTDLKVHDLLIRFTAAFLDQGVSHWPLPEREKGYLEAFCSLYRGGGGPPDAWFRGVPAELARIQDAAIAPLNVILESFELLGIGESEWDAYLSDTLLALRGWGGMIREVEIRSDRVALPIPKDSVIGFVAVRLLLERFAAAHAAREQLGFAGSLADLRTELRKQLPMPQPPGIDARGFPVFLLAQVLAWTPMELHQLTRDEWNGLVREIEAFHELERRRVFHLAYERRFRQQTLDALALHERYRLPALPRFQAITCLDEREESFRRHLEEAAPDCETFGAAGFFAVPMYYRGATDAHFVPLCPIVIVPTHWVEEQAEEKLQGVHERLRRRQRAFGTAAHHAHVGTRTFAFGALITATLGVLASFPLVFRILFPRLTGQTRKYLGGFVQRAPKTRLKLEREPVCEPGPKNGHLGFTLDEMTNMAERLLRDIGLIDGFSRFVLTIGHGSNSLNNPHKSAYDCGACGGTPGAPNGRAAAQILNDGRVRRALELRGIRIPETTWVVGGFHNTCDDSVTFFDLDRIPQTHRAEFEAVERDIEETCDRNAHERCRRFMSAPLTMTPAEARRHVEGRSEDLAQTRPELGHATNAICHVGRRSRTRGLYFDRRNFLTSYDPTQDDDKGTILARTMAAVFPVCGGINLEYYFSHVDSPGYGCATKLPHNITALLGVMDGAMSDLRTGLPWQMTEIHEPVRLLIICETTPEVMFQILANNPLGKAMTENGWVHLMLQSPHSNDLLVFENGEFRPYQVQSDRLPSAPSSIEWYRGWRDHLEFAEIGAK